MANNVEYVDEETYLRELQNKQSSMPSYTTGANAYMPPQDRYGSAIQTLTNPKDDLYKFELFLMSVKKNPDGSFRKLGKPLLNEKGINSMMSCVESLVHHTNTLSNFDDKAVRFMILGLSETITKDLMLNRLAYDVDRKNRDIIVDNVVRFAFGFVLRAFNEGDRKFWKGSMQEVKHTQEVTGQKSGMSLNPFTMFGRK